MSRPLGRPTSYKTEYCAQLIEHMAQGLSFESFAANINCGRRTLYQWLIDYPDFQHAKELGTEKCYQFYEKVGIKAMVGQIPGFVPSVWIVNMRNRFGWKDRPEVAVQINNNSSSPDVEKLTEELKAILMPPDAQKLIDVQTRDVSRGD